MQVRRTERNGVSVLHLEGEFDSFETSMVRDKFESCLGRGAPAVVMDLGGMSFANSTTIAYLITAQRRAKELGGQVVLARPREFLVKTLATLPGMLIMGVVCTVGAMRPDRDPELMSWLYDFAFLSFEGTMGVFLIGSLVWMLAVLLDKNRVFPKWFGYLNLCNALTEVVVAPAWIFKRGVFAWDGEIAWWINMAVFVTYTTVFLTLLRKMILREDFGTGPLPELEPDHALGPAGTLGTAR